MLSKEELLRYKRHLDLPDFGIDKQLLLKSAKVLVIGAGGLGSPVLYYLTAAGVGNIGIVENDVVDISNLQRQILYNTNEIGMPKVEIAAKKLKELNPNVNFNIFNTRLNESNAEDIIKDYEVVVDCPDNFSTRLIISDVTKKMAIPHIYAGVSNYQGQISVFNYKGSCTFRDLFPDINPSVSDKNVTDADKALLGVLPGIIGSIMAIETIKVITNLGTTLCDKLLIVDIKDMSFHLLDISSNK
ncbi:MAG: hypothetical protein Kow0068_01790 [Marinilabiliales bacterium]